MLNFSNDKPPCVLVVDDSDQVLHLLGVLLPAYGVTVRTASGGEAAVELYRAYRDEIALVLSDVQMPGLDGPALLARLQAIDPEVLCWFMSGDTGAYSKQDLLDRGACGVLDKPFRAFEFVAVLDAAGIPVMRREQRTRFVEEWGTPPG